MSNHSIVKALFRKSGKMVYLIYDIKTRFLSGYIFENDPIDLSVMLDIFPTCFPPMLDDIGRFSVQNHRKVDYQIIDQIDKPENYKVIQEILKL